MSFEQQEHSRTQEEKKKKTLEGEKREKFLLEKKVKRESSELIKKLASDIAREFGLDISRAQELIEDTTSGSLEGLKSSIGTTNKSINIPKLYEAIHQAQKSIETLSKKNRETLKKLLDKSTYSPEKYEYYTTETLFPPQIITRAKNPKNIGDQFVGLGLGLIDSSEAVILFTYGLGKGIIFTPYHLYLLLTGQAKYDGFSRI